MLRARSAVIFERSHTASTASDAVSLSSLDQPQDGSGQHQHTGNDQTPIPTGAPVVYQPSGNDLKPPAGANADSDAIVNAQLTHLVSRDDETQGQGATSNQDALMPDASMVHDIATPRRMIGGCRKWCISAQPASGKRK